MISPSIATPPPFDPGTPADQKGLPDALIRLGASLPPDEAARINAHVMELRRRLKELQHRLGTPLETCADLDEAREITHTLHNYLQIKWLWNYLEGGDPRWSVSPSAGR